MNYKQMMMPGTDEVPVKPVGAVGCPLCGCQLTANFRIMSATLGLVYSEDGNVQADPVKAAEHMAHYTRIGMSHGAYCSKCEKYFWIRGSEIELQPNQ